MDCGATGTTTTLPSTLYDKEYFLTACEDIKNSRITRRMLSRRLSQAFAVASVGPGMRVLDVDAGARDCAPLRQLARMLSALIRRVAVDLSHEIIRVAGEPLPGKMGVYQATPSGCRFHRTCLTAR